jgi:cytochrome c oxidase cbb3-type subunit 3/ubiquinol-cytochrome c reductase cytochrome c subunit
VTEPARRTPAIVIAAVVCLSGAVVAGLVAKSRSAPARVPPGPKRALPPPGYGCVWHDEFGGDAGKGQPRAPVNEASWTFQELNVNNEEQVYTTKECATRADWNTCVEDGRLRIRARREDVDCARDGVCAPHFTEKFHATAKYSSARLMSKHKVHYPDGYLEFRVRLPQADRAGAPESGMWPAVWMLGENISEGPPPGDVKWPGCGEVDIMEWSSAKGRSQQGWNFLWQGPGGGTSACSTWPNGGDAACGPCDGKPGECVGTVSASGKHQMKGWPDFDHHGWHTYGLLWENTGNDASDAMTVFIDGVRMGVLHLRPEQAAFKRDMFLTINFALGGMLGGPIQVTDWEHATLDVDYLRWYRKGQPDACGLTGGGTIQHAAAAALAKADTALAAALPAASAVPAAHADGQQLYARYCATCHGKGGDGYAADNAPSLRTTTFMASATDDFIRDGITRGRPGTAMAAYGRALGGPLGPDEVNALIAFLRKGAPPRVVLPPARKGDAKSGKAFYDTMCVKCHGTPTQRATAVHLANPVLLATASDAYLRYAVAEGRFPTPMVAWKQTLPARQIDDLVAYVRSLAPPPGAPVAAAAPAPPVIPRGQIVLNPKGNAPAFTLKENLYVGIDQVAQALKEKRRLIITDARAPSDWTSLHITGAISTPYYDKTSLDDLPNDGTWVLAYCACPHHVSGEVVEELRKRGYKHTAVIDEGVFAWQQKGYPVVMAPNTPPPPAPPPMPAAPPAHAPPPLPTNL